MFNRILGGGSPLPVAVVQSVEYKTSDFNHRFYNSCIRVIITCNKNFLFTARSYTEGYGCFAILKEDIEPTGPLNLQAGKTYTIDIAGSEPGPKHSVGFNDRINFLADGEVFYTTDQAYDTGCSFS